MSIVKKVITGFLLLVVVAAGAFFIFAPAWVDKDQNKLRAHQPYPVSERARTLHGAMFVGDWHADSLLWKRDLTKRNTRGHVDIPRLLEGGVGLQVFTTVTKSPAALNYERNSADARDNITLLAIGQLWPMRTWQSLFQRALYQAEKLVEFERRVPDQLKIVRGLQDLEDLVQARQSGKRVVGGLLGMEGGHALEEKLENLGKLYDAGFRLIGLQHFFDNELGGSLHGISNRGLTEFGKAVVLEAEQKGWIVDLAHSSPAVARDVLEITDMPLVVSHTGVHGFCASKRNFEDPLMKAIVASGGVVGLGYWPDVVCGNISPAGIAKMVLKAIEIVGEDHISLGSDYDGTVETAFDTSELPALTSALLEAGLTETQVRKVMGENMLRVMRARLK